MVVQDGWSPPVQRAVTASLRRQVSALEVDAGGTVEHSDLLVVTSPVVFAPGGVRALLRFASAPGRIVTRVLLPGGEPTDIALWSAAWLRRQDVDLHRIAEYGLDFDRRHLPGDDPQARAWVRADEVGITPISPGAGRPKGSPLVAGLRLGTGRATTSARAVLGRIRRTRALARQRRQHAGG